MADNNNLKFATGNVGAETMRLTSGGNLGIGTTSPNSRLSIDRSSFTGSGIAAMTEHLGFINSTLSAVYYGDSTFISNAPTATSTLVGKIIRVADSTTLGNTVRGMEVQVDRGTNTLGESTALSGFARTFGVRGTTRGDAGALFEPAGGFFETEGTTQGNAIRGYSDTITTASLASLFQEGSTFSGTGLLMNFGNATGTFSGKFVDFQNAGTSKFVVTRHGTTTIGDGTTNNMAGLQIGYGGLCVDNDGSCNASTTGRITSVSTAAGNSDLAEMYFSGQNLDQGEIVYADGGLSVARASEATRERIIGVVSTKPGVTLGFDDTPTSRGESGYPIALTGRVPIKLSTENGPIAIGDQITLSSIPGVGMKARPGDVVVGSALEAFDGTHAYSSGFVNQFSDDIRIPNTTPLNVNNDPRINDGCSFGGGNAINGAKATPCTPKVAGATTDTNEVLGEAAVDAAEEELNDIEALKRIPATTQMTASGEVEVGKVLMFVKLGRFDDIRTADVMRDLLATSTDIVFGGEGESLWDRLKTLAQNFVDGVLTITRLKADSVEIQDQLCIDDVCVTADDLRELLKGNGSGSLPSEPTPPEENNGGGGGQEETPPPETDPEPSPEPIPELVPEPTPPDEPEAESPPEEAASEPDSNEAG